MAKRVEIKVKLVANTEPLGPMFDLILCDKKKVIAKIVDSFIIDTGKTTLSLEGVLQERIEYKSKGQLGYYFGVVLKHITEALIVSGYEELNEEVVDEFLRGKYLTVRYYNEKTGDFMQHVRSISGLFKDEMSDYLKKCIDFATQDLKITIPAAN